MRRSLKITCLVVAVICISAKDTHLYEYAVPLKIDYPDYFGNRITLPVNNPTTVQGVYLGKMLFYESALSASNNISCATCHQQKFAFTDGKQFSKGFDGTLQPRNTMSLTNLLWVRKFFWDGRVDGLENQAEIPLTGQHEMGQLMEVSIKKLINKKIYTPRFKAAFGSDSITGERIKIPLAQFQRTLVSANSRYDQYLLQKYQPTPSELNGIALFYTAPNSTGKIRGAACSHCHGGAKTYSELFHNNGLDSIPEDAGREKITGQSFDRGRFRVATLRNIALTAPYMHDGRFKTLDQVVEHYNEHIVQNNTLSPFLQNISNKVNGKTLHLEEQEKKDLVAFLNMLTDSSFIADKRFSDPFINQ